MDSLPTSASIIRGLQHLKAVWNAQQAGRKPEPVVKFLQWAVEADDIQRLIYLHEPESYALPQIDQIASDRGDPLRNRYTGKDDWFVFRDWRHKRRLDGPQPCVVTTDGDVKTSFGVPHRTYFGNNDAAEQDAEGDTQMAGSEPGPSDGSAPAAQTPQVQGKGKGRAIQRPKKQPDGLEVKVNFSRSSQSPCIELMVSWYSQLLQRHVEAVFRVSGPACAIVTQEDGSTINLMQFWISRADSILNKDEWPGEMHASIDDQQYRVSELTVFLEDDFALDEGRRNSGQAPTWTGLNAAERTKLRLMKLSDAARTGGGDWLINRMLSAKRFTIWEDWKRSVQDIEGFFDSFINAMMVTLLDGDAWFLKANETEKRLRELAVTPQWALDLHLAFPVPRWLVQQYAMVEVDGYTVPIPSKWAQYHIPRAGMQVEPYKLMCGLAAVREHLHHTAAFKQFFLDPKSINLSVNIAGSPVNNWYLVKFSLGAKYDKSNPLPGPNTGIEIKIEVPWTSQDLMLEGTVLPDTWNTGRDFVAVMRGPWLEVNNIRKKEFAVCAITFKDNRLIVHEQINAMLDIANGPEADRGPDWKNFLLAAEAEVQAEKVNEPLQQMVANVGDVSEQFAKLLSYKQSNSSQEQIIRAVDKVAEIIVHGAGGTGKTLTIVKMIIRYWLMGQRVLVVAVTNEAVEKILQVLLDVVKEVGLDHNQIVFARSAHREKLANDEITQALYNWQHERNEDFKEDKYKLYSLAENVSYYAWCYADDEPESEIGQISVEWLAAQRTLKDPKRKPGTAGQARKTANRLSKKIEQHIMELRAGDGYHKQVLLCTTANALGAAKAFGAQTLVIDEGGLLKSSEAAPIALAHLATLLAMAVAGDHLQFKPYFSSIGTNEAGAMQSVSLLEMNASSRYSAHQVHHLDTQYRSEETIFDGPAEYIYGHEGFDIKTDSSANDTVWTRFVQRCNLKLAGEHWNGRHRVGIDCPADLGAKSEPFRNLKSVCNKLEASLALALLIMLYTMVEDDEEVSSIKHELTIVIQTPYVGQLLEIERQYTLWRQNASRLPSTPMFDLARTGGTLTVRTVHQMQGSEAHIVITSMVHNPEINMFKTLGFVARPDLQCVEQTRPMAAAYKVGAHVMWHEGLDNIKATSENRVFRETVKSLARARPENPRRGGNPHPDLLEPDEIFPLWDTVEEIHKAIGEEPVRPRQLPMPVQPKLAPRLGLGGAPVGSKRPASHPSSTGQADTTPQPASTSNTAGATRASGLELLKASLAADSARRLAQPGSPAGPAARVTPAAPRAPAAPRVAAAHSRGTSARAGAAGAARGGGTSARGGAAPSRGPSGLEPRPSKRAKVSEGTAESTSLEQGVAGLGLNKSKHAPTSEMEVDAPETQAPPPPRKKTPPKLDSDPFLDELSGEEFELTTGEKLNLPVWFKCRPNHCEQGIKLGDTVVAGKHKQKLCFAMKNKWDKVKALLPAWRTELGAARDKQASEDRTETALQVMRDEAASSQARAEAEASGSAATGDDGPPSKSPQESEQLNVNPGSTSQVGDDIQ